MSLGKKIVLFSIMIVGIVATSAVAYSYVMNNRDTYVAPSTFSYEPVEISEGYNVLHNNGQFVYYYHSDTDVYLVKDLRNDYVWKSGLDIVPSQTNASSLRRTCNRAIRAKYVDGDDISEEEILESCPDVEEGINSAEVAYRSNSTIVVYYRTVESSNATTYMSSGQASVKKKISVIKNNGVVAGQSVTYDFSKCDGGIFDLQVTVEVLFKDDGIDVQIAKDGIKGEGTKFSHRSETIDEQSKEPTSSSLSKASLTGISIFPYLGSTGGNTLRYDPSIVRYEEVYDEENNKTVIPMYGGYPDVAEYNNSVPGYLMIPDGSGALIRFPDRVKQDFDTIVLPVYGINRTTEKIYNTTSNYYSSGKTASLPLFGMVHGDNQYAYAAYATKGEEYMKIVSAVSGSNSAFPYNNVYANFMLNYEYTVANQSTFTTMLPDILRYDIAMSYKFLSGNGSIDNKPATYIGIANVYKDYLINNHGMEVKKASSNEASDIPLRLDFFMADVEGGVFGLQDVIMTRAADVKEITDDVYNNLSIENLSVGLLGYQKGGVTAGHVYEIQYSGDIGSRGDYNNLFNDLAARGIDISFMQDYYNTNSSAISYWGNATIHVGGWYNQVINWNDQVPIINTGYLRPDKSYLYGTKQVDWFIKDVNAKSVTITGISNNKISEEKDSLSDGLAYYEKLFKESSEKIEVNASAPNSYLWPYITRYLNADPFNSQYLMETDTIPLVSYILNDFVEVYADYANFSFSNKKDALRMIDYNMYPSFVLSKNSSHLLVNTNSNNYYSTEYDLWKDDITRIYSEVNGALSAVCNAKWIDRTVVSNGVIVNKYSNGKSVVINYTENACSYLGNDIPAESSVVISNG